MLNVKQIKHYLKEKHTKQISTEAVDILTTHIKQLMDITAKNCRAKRILAEDLLAVLKARREGIM